MTSFILDTADQPFAHYAFHNKDVLTTAPCVDLKLGMSLDAFAGQCKGQWAHTPDAPRVIHVMRFGVALQPAHEEWTDPETGRTYQGAWLGPPTPEQYAEQILGGFSRFGNEAVWLDEIGARIKPLTNRLDLVYFSTEDQAQCFELPNGHPLWRFIDAMTGDKRLPRNLRFTTRTGKKPITSLAAWLQTRTPYVKQCWYEFFHPMQWGQMRAVLKQSSLGAYDSCSWNQPNYAWTDPATWAKESANTFCTRICLPMYDSEPKWIERYKEILKTFGREVVCYVRPDMPFTEQLKLTDEFDVDIVKVFCDPTRFEEWKRGIGPFIDQIRDMREE